MAKNTKTVVGIDVGGSTTKIVGFKTDENGKSELISPFLVRATDPLTSIYGAFGKFTAENNLSLSDIDRIMVTGVGATYMQKPIYSLNCHTVPEFSAAALGGLYLSGLDRAIVASLGTGTAFVEASRTAGSKHIGGSGVGGGLLSVVDGELGIGIYGPALDEKGNSIAGIAMLEYISKQMDYHMFGDRKKKK